MEQIWEGHNVRLWFIDKPDGSWWIAGGCGIESFEYLSKKGTCQYCGHDIEPGKECPGCSARKDKGESLVAGKAKVSLVGYLPGCLWMLKNPYRIEAHIVSCGRKDVYDSWEYRIVMTNLDFVHQGIEGFGYDEVVRLHLSYTCDVTIEASERIAD